MSRLIEILSSRLTGNQPPAAADLDEARRIADEIAGRDQQGPLILALAVGFHKARQFELALPYAQAAAAKLNTPAAHLNYGRSAAHDRREPDRQQGAAGDRSSGPSPNTTSC